MEDCRWLFQRNWSLRANVNGSKIIGTYRVLVNCALQLLCTLYFSIVTLSILYVLVEYRLTSFDLRGSDFLRISFSPLFLFLSVSLLLWSTLPHSLSLLLSVSLGCWSLSLSLLRRFHLFLSLSVVFCRFCLIVLLVDTILLYYYNPFLFSLSFPVLSSDGALTVCCKCLALPVSLAEILVSNLPHHFIPNTLLFFISFQFLSLWTRLILQEPSVHIPSQYIQYILPG